jgi:hypothetical protein
VQPVGVMVGHAGSVWMQQQRITPYVQQHEGGGLSGSAERWICGRRMPVDSGAGWLCLEPGCG